MKKIINTSLFSIYFASFCTLVYAAEPAEYLQSCNPVLGTFLNETIDSSQSTYSASALAKLYQSLKDKGVVEINESNDSGGGNGVLEVADKLKIGGGGQRERYRLNAHQDQELVQALSSQDSWNEFQQQHNLHQNTFTNQMAATEFNRCVQTLMSARPSELGVFTFPYPNYDQAGNLRTLDIDLRLVVPDGNRSQNRSIVDINPNWACKTRGREIAINSNGAGFPLGAVLQHQLRCVPTEALSDVNDANFALSVSNENSETKNSNPIKIALKKPSNDVLQRLNMELQNNLNQYKYILNSYNQNILKNPSFESALPPESGYPIRSWANGNETSRITRESYGQQYMALLWAGSIAQTFSDSEIASNISFKTSVKLRSNGSGKATLVVWELGCPGSPSQNCQTVINDINVTPSSDWQIVTGNYTRANASQRGNTVKLELYWNPVDVVQPLQIDDFMLTPVSTH